MTTNIYRWFQAALVVGLTLLSCWQASMAGASKTSAVGLSHLMATCLLILPVAILICEEGYGNLVLRRSLLLGSLTGVVWFGYKAFDHFDARLILIKGDLLQAGFYVLMLVILCLNEWRRARGTGESVCSESGYDGPSPSIPVSSDPLPTERGVWYPD